MRMRDAQNFQYVSPFLFLSLFRQIRSPGRFLRRVKTILKALHDYRVENYKGPSIIFQT